MFWGGGFILKSGWPVSAVNDCAMAFILPEQLVGLFFCYIIICNISTVKVHNFPFGKIDIVYK